MINLMKFRFPGAKISRSVYRGTVKTHPDLGVDVVYKQDNVLGNDWDTITKINRILSTSLSEFIRRDLTNIKSQMPLKGSGETNNNNYGPGCKASVEQIYDYLLKEPDMQKRIQHSMEDGGDRLKIL